MPASLQPKDLVIALRLEDLWFRLHWLVRLRWYAIGGVVGIVGLAWKLDAIESEVPLLAIAAVLAIGNLAAWRWLFVDRRAGGFQDLERQAFVQIALDALMLTGLLHWSDGVENPFAMLFCLQGAIAGKLLRRPLALTFGAWTLGVYGAVLIAEHFGLIAHHEFFLSIDGGVEEEPIQSAVYLASHLFALGLALLGTISFVSTSTTRFHHAAAEQVRSERLVATRERLAKVGELTAGVAHSIRNPLHGALNCLDILRTVPADEAVGVETLDMLETALRRMELMTRRLLALTREQALDLNPTDLSTLASDLVQSMRSGAPPALELRFEGVGETTARVDMAQAREALANVVDNAVQACAGQGRILVTVGPADEEEDTIWISVEDTGPGIPAQDLELVFTPFYTTKPMGQGAGLGLAITRRIVEEHGGMVFIEGTTGGTRVRMAFPRGGPARELRVDRP